MTICLKNQIHLNIYALSVFIKVEIKHYEY